MNNVIEETAILSIIAKREGDMLDESKPILITLGNPFRRKGTTAEDIAYGMEWHTGKVLASGRIQADLPRARKALKAMVKAGLLEAIGHARTLQCGSKYKEQYATLGFLEACEKRLQTHGLVTVNDCNNL